MDVFTRNGIAGFQIYDIPLVNSTMELVISTNLFDIPPLSIRVVRLPQMDVLARNGIRRIQVNGILRIDITSYDDITILV
jgi:hypothetical protein